MKAWLNRLSNTDSLAGRTVDRARRTAVRTLHRRRDRATIQRLRVLPDSAAVPLADALTRTEAYDLAAMPPLVRATEAERRRLLSDLSPLCAGPDCLPWDEGRTVRDACLASSAPRRAALLLELTRACAPANVLELGTNVGVGTAYLAAALEDSATDKSLVTLDASPDRLRVAQALHATVGLDHVRYVPGLFDDTLGSVLADLGRIDLAFIDGNHHREPTLAYFEAIAACMEAGGVCVFDDIRWSEGMAAAWREIHMHPRVRLLLDFGWLGLTVLRGPEEAPRPPLQVAPMRSVTV